MKLHKMMVKDLLPWKKNPRSICNESLSGLAASIDKFGVVQPIIWNKKTKRVVGGHQRLRVLQAKKTRETDVIVVDLSEREEKILNVALNNQAIAGEFTPDVETILDEILESDNDLYELLRLDEIEWDSLEIPGVVVEDEVPDVPKKAITKRGDLWELGNHRVLCGDCTNKKDFDLLIGDEKVDVCLTDPPYGIGLDYESFDDTEKAVTELAKRWLPIVRGVAPVVVFTSGVTRQWIYPSPDWVMCWFYGGGQLRSPWGFNCWQPIVCYGKDPSLASGNGCRPDAVNLNTPANAKDIDHPCPKPMQLWVWLIERLSIKTGQIIIDPFLGSGTTLIAAEQLDRICYGVEIEPKYCDVIVERWQNLTGKKAKRIRRT